MTEIKNQKSEIKNGEATVSVVIPAFNAERFIRQALDSVLAQSWHDLEVVVVNDGSTDATREIAASYGEPVRVADQANAGPSTARNRGIHEAKGQFVAFLDADDLWLPEKLAEQMPLFDDRRVGLVYCRIRRIDEAGEAVATRQEPKLAGQCYYRLLEGNVVATSSAVVRTSCFERAGGFPTDMKWAEDWHLWLRIARDHELAYVDGPLVLRRTHAASLWAQREKAHQGALDVLARTARDSDDPRTRTVARRTTRRIRRNYGVNLLRRGEWAAGRRALWSALRRWPFDPLGAAAFVLALAPPFLRSLLVAGWRARPRPRGPEPQSAGEGSPHE